MDIDGRYQIARTYLTFHCALILSPRPTCRHALPVTVAPNLSPPPFSCHYTPSPSPLREKNRDDLTAPPSSDGGLHSSNGRRFHRKVGGSKEACTVVMVEGFMEAVY